MFFIDFKLKSVNGLFLIDMATTNWAGGGSEGKWDGGVRDACNVRDGMASATSEWEHAHGGTERGEFSGRYGVCVRRLPIVGEAQ